MQDKSSIDRNHERSHIISKLKVETSLSDLYTQEPGSFTVYHFTIFYNSLFDLS